MIAGDPLEVDGLGQRHAAAVDFQRLPPPLLVRDADLDLPVEAPGAAQRRVERVGNVGGGDEDHLPARFEAVHQGEQLRDDAAFDLALARHLLALRRDGVDLVDEDDGKERFFPPPRTSCADCASLAP